MADDPKPSPLFMSLARSSVKEMRDAGMTEAFIAICLLDIRAAAIAEERQRISLLLSKNTPQYPRWPVVEEMLKDV